MTQRWILTGRSRQKKMDVPDPTSLFIPANKDLFPDPWRSGPSNKSTCYFVRHCSNALQLLTHLILTSSLGGRKLPQFYIGQNWDPEWVTCSRSQSQWWGWGCAHVHQAVLFRRTQLVSGWCLLAPVLPMMLHFGLLSLPLGNFPWAEMRFCTQKRNLSLEFTYQRQLNYTGKKPALIQCLLCIKTCASWKTAVSVHSHVTSG